MRTKNPLFQLIAARTILREITNETGAFAARYTVPVYRMDEREIPDHLASAILVEHEGSNCLVTAAHVFDESPCNLYLITVNGPVAIEGTLHSTGNSAERKLDKIDIAVLKLKESTVKNLSGVSFLPSRYLEQGVIAPKKRDFYLSFGYPNSKQGKRDTVNHKVIQNPAPIGCLAQDLRQYARVGANPRFNLVLGYFRKRIVHSNDRVQLGPFPRGMSGCGIWGVGALSQYISISYEDWEPKLSGIFIEFHAPENAILVTQSWVVMNLLRKVQLDSGK